MAITDRPRDALAREMGEERYIVHGIGTGMVAAAKPCSKVPAHALPPNPGPFGHHKGQAAGAQRSRAPEKGRHRPLSA